jgi:hypothetical protein
LPYLSLRILRPGYDLGLRSISSGSDAPHIFGHGIPFIRRHELVEEHRLRISRSQKSISFPEEKPSSMDYLPVNADTAFDLSHRIEKVVKVFDEKDAAQCVVLDPEIHTQDEGAEIHEETEGAKEGFPAHKICRCVIMTARQDDL